MTTTTKRTARPRKYRRRKEWQPTFTAAELETVRRMSLDGATAPEIAAAIGRPPRLVPYARKRLREAGRLPDANELKARRAPTPAEIRAACAQLAELYADDHDAEHNGADVDYAPYYRPVITLAPRGTRLLGGSRHPL